jgi:ribosome-associated protein
MTERAATIKNDVRRAARALEEHRARDLVVLDLRPVSDATDYFLIATGTSDTHVRALAERVMQAMEAAGSTPHHVEGLAGGRWVLLDFVDYVVHVFHPSQREFYQLERLWADATPVSATLDR